MGCSLIRVLFRRQRHITRVDHHQCFGDCNFHQQFMQLRVGLENLPTPKNEEFLLVGAQSDQQLQSRLPPDAAAAQCCSPGQV